MESTLTRDKRGMAQAGWLLVGLLCFGSCDNAPCSKADPSSGSGLERDTATADDSTHSGDADSETPVEPELLWSKGPLCPEKYAQTDLHVSQDVFAARIPWHGREKQVLVSVLDGLLSPGASATTLEPAILDVQTGETLECRTLPEQSAYGSPRVVYDDSADAYFYAYKTTSGEGAMPSP